MGKNSQIDQTIDFISPITKLDINNLRINQVLTLSYIEQKE
ncbi:MAG: hypothetical protein ACI86M_001920 [Saprospiraceae bacterium]|jgi:hypothetical protein